MKKYKFRKAYFICEDKQIFPNKNEFVNCYKNAAYVNKASVEKQQRKIDEVNTLYHPTLRVIPKLKVEGFYLVHESLFDEILKQWSKD